MSKKSVVYFLIVMGILASGVGFIVTSKSTGTDSRMRHSLQTSGLTDIQPDQPDGNQRIITHAPESLVVKAEDLPGTFAINSGESSAKNEYSHVFFNPYALLDGEQRDHGLLGIIVQIKLMDSVYRAQKEFVAQGGFDIETVKADLRKATPGAKPISIEPHPLSLHDVDKVTAYRVHYLLQGVYVYDYRCRMIVRNVVTNVIVSARGSAEIEPKDLQKQAVEIFQKQQTRLWQSMN